MFGGAKLLSRADRVEMAAEPVQTARPPPGASRSAMIGVLILGVIFGGFNIGMAAFAGAVLLSLLRAADDGEAIKRMPWSTILMVCGVTVLIGLLEKTGGMEIFTDLLSSIATQATVIPLLAVRSSASCRRTRARRASCCRRSCRRCRG